MWMFIIPWYGSMAFISNYKKVEII